MTDKTTDNTVVMPNAIGCRHCGQAITLNMPLPLDMAVAILRAFADLHQFCHRQTVFTADVMIGGESEREGEAAHD